MDDVIHIPRRVEGRLGQQKGRQVRKADTALATRAIQLVLSEPVDEGAELQRVPAPGIEGVIAPGEDVLFVIIRLDTQGSKICQSRDGDTTHFPPRHKGVLWTAEPRRRIHL